MTGLEKIIGHIEENSVASVREIISAAKEKADGIALDAQTEVEKTTAEITERTKRETQDTISRAKSYATLQEKKLILTAKQQLISDIIDKAKQQLISLSDKEYFEIILSMIKRYSINQSGEIAFSKSDLARLPQDFDNTISTALSDKENAKLAISKDAVEIDGGFVLIYGEVEENCSFSSLFLAARELLQDKVSALLFS
ncbi:MAG TPA: V-type ATP synthase subunit E family protein [Oscillospiraceae bacterium]|nr:V-type ATP synthase subunit E family protein [Oscillospiraceae bacterium]